MVKEKFVDYVLDIDAELLNEIKTKADALGLSISEFIIFLVGRGLTHQHESSEVSQNHLSHDSQDSQSQTELI
jgi:hypothetical protein